MKHWQETSRIMQLLVDLAQQGKTAALATVIDIEGSAYRRPGAKMLILEDGAMFGSVSGGCLEADVREVALSVMRTGEPRLLHYDTGTDYQLPIGLGLGCNGSVDIFVQRVVPDLLEVAVPLTQLLRGDDPFAVCTVIRGPRAIGCSLVITPRGILVGSTGDLNLDRRVAIGCEPASRHGLVGTAGCRRLRDFCRSAGAASIALYFRRWRGYASRSPGSRRKSDSASPSSITAGVPLVR